MDDLTDIEWVALDILMRAKSIKEGYVHRLVLLNNEDLPATVRARLVMTLLLMSNGKFVRCQNKHEFSITDEGVQIYQLKFGTPAKPEPKGSSIAHAVICLPYLPIGSKMQ